MRKVTFLLIVAMAAAASLAQPVLAQDKAAEVLANVRKALGDGKLDSLRTFSLEAKSARNQGERQLVTDLELYFEMPDKYLRVENFTAPVPRTMSMGFNGDKVIRPAGSNAAGGPVMIMNGVPAGGGGGQRMTVEMAVAGGGTRGGGPAGAPPTPEQQAMMDASMIRSQRVELSRLMLGWFAQAHPGLKATYTYGGEAESPDGKAHIINIKADGGFDAKLFVDQATNIPLMVSWQALEPIRLPGRAGGPAPAGTPPPPPPPPAAGHNHPVVAAPPQTGEQMTREEMQRQLDEAMKNRKMIEYRVYFGDWQEVDGIKFPHTLQRATGSNTTEEWTISKVKVNPKIDAKKFQ